MGSSGISSLQLTKTPILFFFMIGLVFVLLVNPISAVFQKEFHELDYKYMKRVDRLTSISKNGIWLMQENVNGITNIIYAKRGGELECGSYNGHYKKYSNCNVLHSNNYVDFVELIKANF